ncbi:MAG: internal scaffolding protein [Microvirus sp.]|nr:MAG: internal scaffolding protein [Microvirus sp.]
MANVKFPQAVHDFAKSNGSDTVYNTVGPSLTRQEFAEECDINSLMRRYETYVTGGPGNLPMSGPGMYADFTQLPRTLLEYLEFMKVADASFMSLPAAVRKEFDNSPEMFVDFASDPENLPQMRTWGLAPPVEVAQEPSVPPAVSASPPAAAAPAAPVGASTHGST